MKKNRGWNNIIWATRKIKDGHFQNGSHIVRVLEDGFIAYSQQCDGPTWRVVSRLEARLLAHRILQALEETE